MRAWSELELEAWREVGKHLELGESLLPLHVLVAERLGQRSTVLRSLDPEANQLVTLAQAGDASRAVAARSAIPRETTREVLAWAREPRIVGTDQPGGRDLLARVLASPIDGRAQGVGIRDDDGRTGVVVWTGAERAETIDATTARRWIDLFATAMSNDARLRELRRLREALEAENRALLSRLDRQDISEAIVGADGGLREVLRKVEQVAATEAPVLLLGATGSGKEVIARAIHTRSPRASGPMVKVNCGAIPHELVDSELFGHERGSFTGATDTRRGWFERADGGTLFLDEMGELPPAAQVRLLRVLQDGTLSRVGGGAPIKVDVRIVAATHRDLQAMVDDGTFRQDLWYRIGVFPIRLPPLRERPEDIPSLANHFAWRAGKRLAGVPLALQPADVDLLLAYDWPGNVRELAAVIERAAILGDGRRLEIQAAFGGTPVRAPREVARVPASPAAPLKTLDAAAIEHIERALARTGGRIEGRDGAARLLDINPHTLRSRMRTLGVDWRSFRPRKR